MKAFWTIRPAVQDDEGAWSPDLPSGLRWQNNGDIRLMPQGANDHKHVVVGCIALGTNHYHWVFYRDGVILQEYVGNPVNDHDHAIVDEPWQFMVFVNCYEADYDALLAAYPNIIILGHCEVTETPDESDPGRSSYTFGAVDNTAWDAGTRTAWETRFENFGLVLPDVVTNDRRLVHYTLALFHAPRQGLKNERNYRYSGAVADSGL